jgi:hypothetical protein
MKKMGFIPGVIVGVAGIWAFHHFVKPVPGAKSSS